MKNLNVIVHVEVTDKPYLIHPTGISKLLERKAPKSLRNESQFIIETQKRTKSNSYYISKKKQIRSQTLTKTKKENNL